jgi:hypothetical protein
MIRTTCCRARYTRLIAVPLWIRSARCVVVGEAADVDSDESVAEVVAKRCDASEDLCGAREGLRLPRLRIGDEVELLESRSGTEPATPRPLLIREGVA